MTVNLPTGENNSGSNDWSDVYSNDAALKAALETAQGELSTLKAESPVTWYTPKIIATEESRTNTSFGTLSTADEITGVVVPENALIFVGYSALAKCSSVEAGRAGLFFGSTQVVGFSGGAGPSGVEVTVPSGTFTQIASSSIGLSAGPGIGTSAPASTGQLLGSETPRGGGLMIGTAAAGTYTVSVRYKATTGSVTAKTRKLWVAVLG